MTQEEKAEAYSKAMEKAKQEYNTATSEDRKQWLEELFPELKESEGEKIRKAIVSGMVALKEQGRETFATININDCISWLEKQGEQKPCMIQWKGDNLKEVVGFTGKDKNFEKWFKSFEEYERYVLEHNNIFKLFNADGSHYEVPVGAWIVKTPDGYNVASKAIFRQKSVDTPKFKVGDWVVVNNKHQSIYQVEKIEDGYYILRHTHGGTFRVCVLHDESLRFWNISDVKAGDVLASKDGEDILIFARLDSITSFSCYYSIRGKWNSGWYNNWFIPATKEQRDLLFKAMEGAGYTFDFDKKELKEIEDEEYDGEDYGIDSLWHAKNILEKTLGKVKGYQTDDGILSHKCAISAVDKLYKQKHVTWSEEDDRLLRVCVAAINGIDNFCSENKQELTDWLKSLKERLPEKSIK